jgi:hypothetical protein
MVKLNKRLNTNEVQHNYASKRKKMISEAQKID